MLPYTICFIKKGTKILLLNRSNTPNMGLWNGVGGKIEADETPEENIKREITEETGLILENVIYKGAVEWENEHIQSGMYLFLVEVDETEIIDVNFSTSEGVLDWKEIDWILNKENKGIVSNISRYLPIALESSEIYTHRLKYRKGVILEYSPIKQ